MNDQERIIEQAEKSAYFEKVEGNVYNNYASDHKIPRHLTPRPFQSERFLGREDALQAIHDQLFNDNPLLLLVNGEGGVGKTTLAARYYDTYQAEYQHLAWVLSEQDIANALLKALEQPLGLNFTNDQQTAERLTILLTAIASLNQPCLLVIDNANDVEELNKIYSDLRRCSNCHLLLTTRLTQFAQAARYRIEGLPEAEALSLFKAYYPQHQDDEDELVKQIHAAVGGNTLVIELLAKNLDAVNQFEHRYTVADLLNELRRKGLLTLSESAAITTAYQAKGQLRAAKPEEIIAAMYDLMALSTAEVALLSVFAVLPAEKIAYTTLKSLLATLANLPDTLKSLAQKGWIDYNPSDKTCKCSPVIQDITRPKNPNLRVDCQGLIDALLDKLDRDRLHLDNYQTANLMARFGESVLLALTIADWDLHCLCDSMGYYYLAVGNLSLAQASYEKERELIQQLLEADPENPDLLLSLAATFNWLGRTHSALGNLEQALQFYQDNNALAKALHDSATNNVDFKKSLAISYQFLGNTHADLGNLEKAVQCCQDFNALAKVLHDTAPNNVDFKNGLAISYQFLGNTHAELGNLEQALQYYQDYNALEKALHESAPNNVVFKNLLAISYQHLGITHADLGNLELALQYYQDFNSLAEALHASAPDNVEFKNNLAISFQYLGITHAKLGNLEQALQYYQDHNTLEKALHASAPENVEFKYILAISYQYLGNTHAALGSLEQALQYYQDSNDLAEALHVSAPDNVVFKNGLAISFSNLGWINEQMGNQTEAKAFYQQSQALSTQLVKDSPAYVEFKNNLAWVTDRLAALAAS